MKKLLTITLLSLLYCCIHNNDINGIGGNAITEQSIGY